MIAAPIPSRESARLAALHRLQLLNTGSEPAFDELAQLAAYVCRTPIAVISFVDATRQWFKSVVGLPYTESPRSIAFCAHTILGTDLFIVEEADTDERFDDHPWVVGSPSIRFYAGVPLITSDGHAIGSLAVMDVVPRTLNPEQRTAMQTLAKQVMAQVELRETRGSLQAMTWDDPVSAVFPRATEERSKQELLLALMLNTGPGCIKRVAADGTLLHMNPAGLKLIEASCEQEAVGRSVFDLISPGHRAAFMRMHQDVLGGTARTLQFEIQGLQGARRWLETHAVPFQNPVTGGTEHLAITYDITERKRADKDLRISGERLHQALRASNTGLWDWNTETGEVSYSKEWKSQLGYDESELPDSFETWVSRLHPDDRDRAILYAQRYRDNPVGAFRQDFRLRHKDGSYRWFDSHASFVTEADGRRVRLLGSHTDITERKQTEEALGESEERFRAAYRNATIGMSTADLNGRIQAVNHALCAILGYSEEELLARTFQSFTHPDDLGQNLERVRKLLAGEVPSDVIEKRYVRKDGGIVWAQVGLSVIRDAAGNPVHTLAMVQDITERKRAEEALQLAKFTVDCATEAIYWVGSGAELLDVNEAACAMLGYSKEEFRRMTVHDINPSFQPDSWPAYWEETRQRGAVSFESVHQAKNGRLISIEVNVNFLSYQGRECHCAFVRDITERKQAEQQRAQALHSLQTIMETVPDIIFSLDTQERLSSWNKKMEMVNGTESMNCF